MSSSSRNSRVTTRSAPFTGRVRAELCTHRALARRSWPNFLRPRSYAIYIARPCGNSPTARLSTPRRCSAISPSIANGDGRSTTRSVRSACVASARQTRSPSASAASGARPPSSAEAAPAARANGPSGIEEGAQFARAARVLKLAQGLGLALPDALAGHRELLADLLERVVGVHADAEAHAQHALFPRGQGGENPGRGFAQIAVDGGVQRQHRVLILDEVAEMGVLFIANGRLEADRLLGDLQDLAHLLQGHAELLGKLLGRRLAADLVKHLARGTHQLVDRLDHVHRDADGARLVGDRAGDRLANPPGGIGREFIAAAVFELIDRLHQADVAFLDKVEELQAAVSVFLGDGDDEAQIGLDHFLLGARGFALAALHRRKDATELDRRHAGLGRDGGDLRAQRLDLVAVLGDERGPALGGEPADARHPIRLQFMAQMVTEEIRTLDAGMLGEAQ